MKKLVVLSVVALLVLAVVPATLAQREPGYVVFANGYWEQWPCGAWGVVRIDIDIYYTSDDVGLQHVEWQSTLIGDGEFDATAPGQFVWLESDAMFGVPPDGDVWETWDVVTDSGDVIATLDAYASCVTGEISIFVSNIFDTLEPDPAERVLATVLYDTPVYSAPDPGSALAGVVLTAGQTWFVVGSGTGTDGALWYEVFVGGAHNGFVPAAALELQGALP